MRVLITGICGYVGSRLALAIAETQPEIEVIGIDNLSRRGSETYLDLVTRICIQFYRGDIRVVSDISALPDTDWVIDCAANPTVLAGVTSNSGSTPRQVVEHNLVGTLNILEYCRERQAGLVLLSTSRVYSANQLSQLPLQETPTRFQLDMGVSSPPKGLTEYGISEEFATNAPLSLYGATKLTSEIMAQEYSAAFDFPLWINRCGVIGGPGQLGKIDQGIFAFWVYSCVLGRPLRYIGYGGTGKQVRDCVLADDVATLVIKQIMSPKRAAPCISNVGGGMAGALSLLELTEICADFLGQEIPIASTPETRPYDVPYYITDFRQLESAWEWRPTKSGEQIATELCEWTVNNLPFVQNLFRGN